MPKRAQSRNRTAAGHQRYTGIVGLDGNSMAADILDRRCYVACLIRLRYIGQHNIEAILGEAQGDRRTDTARPTKDESNPGAQGTRTSLPAVLRLSMSACAFAASANRCSPPRRILSFPSEIQSKSCAERARNSSGVWIWSRNPA